MAEIGQGRSTRAVIGAKTMPHAPTGQGSTGSEGESSGAGSIYDAVLVERVNKSVRNMGPSRPMSAVIDPALPSVMMSSRNTGTVSG